MEALLVFLLVDFSTSVSALQDGICRIFDRGPGNPSLHNRPNRDHDEHQPDQDPSIIQPMNHPSYQCMVYPRHQLQTRCPATRRCIYDWCRRCNPPRRILTRPRVPRNTLIDYFDDLARARGQFLAYDDGLK